MEYSARQATHRSVCPHATIGDKPKDGQRRAATAHCRSAQVSRNPETGKQDQDKHNRSHTSQHHPLPTPDRRIRNDNPRFLERNLCDHRILGFLRISKIRSILPDTESMRTSRAPTRTMVSSPRSEYGFRPNTSLARVRCFSAPHSSTVRESLRRHP